MAFMKAKKRGQRPQVAVWRPLTTTFFVAALACLATLLVSDALRHLRFTAAHQRQAALPLLLIGLSYVCLQLSARRPRSELIKGLLLGFAFMLWGMEQLLPVSPLVTLMDGAVVTIFVVDLSFIIVEHLKRRDHDLP